MSYVRVIARLDIKGANLIKGIHLEGLRVVGDPNAFAQRYYQQGIDELIFMDSVASLYNRNSLIDVIHRSTRDIFVPITIGGGVRSVEDAITLLRAGADKIAINTAAVRRPELISELAQRLGSQCVVLSVEAKRNSRGWEAYTDNGRERTGLDVVEWTKRAASLGAGEILLTSVDREGTLKGFDIELVQAVTSAVPVPVIASGGMGGLPHLVSVVRDGGADAVAMAHVLHYGVVELNQIRAQAAAKGVSVRLA